MASNWQVQAPSQNLPPVTPEAAEQTNRRIAINVIRAPAATEFPLIPPHTHFPFSPESGTPEPLESSPCCNQPSRCTSAVRQPRSPGCRRSCLVPPRRMKGIA